MNAYLEEYSSEEAIRKYTSETAGHGISYLLGHDYAETYLTAINQFLKVRADLPIRLLEFGCGGGMNVITLLSLLERNGRKVEIAYGTDFSERLVQAANDESKALLTPEQQKEIHFAVARNEELISDLAEAAHTSRTELINSFHVILGVNTSRYGHRLGKALRCAQDIADLLVTGRDLHHDRHESQVSRFSQ